MRKELGLCRYKQRKRDRRDICFFYSFFTRFLTPEKPVPPFAVGIIPFVRKARKIASCIAELV